MTVKRNKQIEESRKLIQESLLQLLEKQPLNQISVTLLCDEAGLSRRTFPRHFASIEDVFKAIVNQKVLVLYDEVKSLKISHFSELITFLFDFFSKDKSFLAILVKNNRFFMLENQLEINISKSLLVTQFHSDIYVSAFALGGITKLLHQWIELDFNKSSKEMAEVADQIAAHLQEVR
ncbi:TetR/AcrR family transcriptional regulator [Fructobacillus sp. M1-13]|uniref:TetR/AcrR family transcriptional regulator n=1 Tax=Fructobacillus papyriferae TaxID=2713171 RepID=A0ABS5QRM6_9LACO|nr:TetR/AcrR family transcriptional regulator [Fructobacillus papyriferae]MBS9334617.1 TetR/AcrR family transcriptional regulator [Fructobacillus papyriferae]MCD2158607.1 TetR/AcrR family transcriptional regulator [Fructobacillus papyriferae]